eukprot:jgi/Chlat1/2180/Chrsp17S02753
MAPRDAAAGVVDDKAALVVDGAGVERSLSGCADVDSGHDGSPSTSNSPAAAGAGGHQQHCPKCLERETAVHRFLRSTLRGAVIGGGLKGGLQLFALVGHLRKRSSLQRRGAKLHSVSHEVSLVGRETLRYALFLGTFAGGFSCLDEALAAVFGRRRSAGWRSLLAGGLAGPALLLTGWGSRHYSMAVYILLRGLVLLARCGLKWDRTKNFCKPLAWKHGDVALMCLSSAQILYAWILQPSTLPPSYISFLNKHGGKDVSIIRTLAQIIARGGATGPNSRTASAPPPSNLPKLPCPVVHSGLSCTWHYLSFFPSAYMRALPVYLPVYLVPALLVHRAGLLTRPLNIITKALMGAFRSSVFLAAYCTTAWGGTCLTHNLLQSTSGAKLALGAAPAGLAVLFEKKSRRMELALYCTARAIESFARCTTAWGWVKGVHLLQRLDVVLFSLATATIMHCYSRERDVFRSKYLNILDWVFGVPPEDPGDYVKLH